MSSDDVGSSTSVFKNHPSAHVSCVQHSSFAFSQSEPSFSEPNPSSSAHTNMATVAATHVVVTDQAWYSDTGALTHMASNPSAFTDYNSYSGSSTVVVGNGQCVSISHIGNFVLSNGSDGLLLKTLLYVLDIRKNL